MTPNDSTPGRPGPRRRPQLTIMQLQDLQERFQYELQFAEQLCTWHPDEAGDWRLMAEAAQRRRRSRRATWTRRAHHGSRTDPVAHRSHRQDVHHLLLATGTST